MKLLELVAGPDTSAAAKARCEAWGKDALGKGIVWAKDTPNFIGNRIGVQSMMTVIHLMLEMGLAPEGFDDSDGFGQFCVQDLPHGGGKGADRAGHLHRVGKRYPGHARLMISGGQLRKEWYRLECGRWSH